MATGNGYPEGGDADREPKLLNVAEVAALMRVPMVTVYRLVHAGALPAVRVGRSIRVSLEDASALLGGRDGADR